MCGLESLDGDQEVVKMPSFQQNSNTPTSTPISPTFSPITPPPITQTSPTIVPSPRHKDTNILLQHIHHHNKKILLLQLHHQNKDLWDRPLPAVPSELGKEGSELMKFCHPEDSGRMDPRYESVSLTSVMRSLQGQEQVVGLLTALNKSVQMQQPVVGLLNAIKGLLIQNSKLLAGLIKHFN